MQSALEKTAGVSDLKIPDSEPDYTTFQGQLIQYTGEANAEDVIAILHDKTVFSVSIAEAPEEKKHSELEDNNFK